MFAKLGSDLKKPDATTEITQDNFKQIVWPLPVDSLMYVGRGRNETLKRLNILTCGDLANAQENVLTHHFGVGGKEIIDIAKGLDQSEVALYSDNAAVKSIGNGTTAIHDITTKDEFDKVAYFLCDCISTRMRKKALCSNTITLSIKDKELKWVSFSKTFASSICHTKDLFDATNQLFQKNWKISTPIRAIRIACSNLLSDKSARQLDLFSSESTFNKKTKEEESIDKIRDKYGVSGIKKALLLNTEDLIRTVEDDEFY